MLEPHSRGVSIILVLAPPPNENDGCYVCIGWRSVSLTGLGVLLNGSDSPKLLLQRLIAITAGQGFASLGQSD